MNVDIIQRKINRVRSGQPPRLLDLFAGCGGLTLGFHAAGFEPAGAIESDEHAAASYGLNFHDASPSHSAARDITSTTPAELALALGLGRVEEAFDVIVGGPPCQAFARVGRSKLREIEAHPEAFKQDPRARLYIEYLNYVEECHPLAVLIENVPDVLNHGGQNIAEEICEVLQRKGYKTSYTLLNAAYYGVPQMRERMFLIGLRKELDIAPSFPKATHWADLPSGYEGSRAVALKLLKSPPLFDAVNCYIEPPSARSNLLPAVSTREALDDLPRLDARQLVAQGRLRRGARRFDEPIPYHEPAQRSPYADLMRSWEGFKGGSRLADHVIRYLPRDFDLFARMNPGDQYPEAHSHAEDMFEEKLAELRSGGERIEKNSDRWQAIRSSIVPPYDRGKFPNKWRKMEPDQPARTLMAHLGKDGYSHIHYDSAQARTISVREAARLQSFPDGFRFCGTMNPAFRQIGNAVPPLLAKALALEIRMSLKGTKEQANVHRHEEEAVLAGSSQA